MADLKTLRVYMDGQQTACNVSSVNDAWQVYFVYHHSTHDVMIKLPESSVPDSSVVPTASPEQQNTEPSANQNVPQENLTSVAIIVGAIVAIVAVSGLLVYVARRQKKQLS